RTCGKSNGTWIWLILILPVLKPRHYPSYPHRLSLPRSFPKTPQIVLRAKHSTGKRLGKSALFSAKTARWGVLIAVLSVQSSCTPCCLKRSHIIHTSSLDTYLITSRQARG